MSIQGQKNQENFSLISCLSICVSLLLPVGGLFIIVFILRKKKVKGEFKANFIL